MDKDKLIKQLQEQNKLLRAECKAADETDTALKAWANEAAPKKQRAWNKYVKLWNAWQEAKAARIATEPPF